MANPSVMANWHDRRGGCPVTSREEWKAIQLGLRMSMARVIDAAQAIMRVTGKTFEDVRDRHLVCDPREAPERSVMLALWRRDEE